MENKIKVSLKKYLKENDIELNNISAEDIDNFTNENEDWLGFGTTQVQRECDGWTEARFYTTYKGKGLTITFDHECNIDYEDNKFVDMVTKLLSLKNECDRVINLFK